VAGPIFRRQLLRASDGGEIDFPVFQGGFAAVEAEYVVVLSRDVAPRDRTWSTLEAREVVRDVCCGVETAGSPLRAINALGATAVASDFGNTAGLILGSGIGDWPARYPDDLTTETFIDGERVGRGGARSLPDGPLGFLAAALEQLGSRGRWLRAVDVISTGATTGIHEIRAGQHARVVFAGVGEIRCRAIPAVRSELRDAGSRV
jgi:2-keto-4-pentenoate hydratase